MARPSLLVLQSGGPTAVINATLAGVLEGAREQGFGRVLGALRGFSGLLKGHLVDLTALSGDRLERLARTPGAALGTSRERVDARSAPQALRILDQQRIETAVVIGGNDTAANAQALLTAATEAGQPLTVIHAPKTIDNDLPETDHTPGYPSAARFLARATRDILIDSWSVHDLYPVTLLEVQGRNAGWLAAACAVAAPALLRDHLLLFFPERPPESPASLIDELLEAKQARGWLVAVIPETLRDRRGQPVAGPAARWVDPHGHPYPASPAESLATALATQAGLRARVIRPNALARSFTATACPLDREEARAIGRTAVAWARAGQQAVMVAIQRLSDEPYRVEFRPVGIEAVAARERLLPGDFIGSDDRSVTEAFRSYARPLLGHLDAEEPILFD